MKAYELIPKVATHCGANQVASCGTDNCYVQRTDECEELMTDPGIASVPPVRAVRVEGKEL